MTRRLSIIACIALFTCAFVAVASASVTKSKSKTVTVDKGKTRTVTVVYPDAQKFGDAKYKCSAVVTSGKASVTKGSAQGGSVCQAKIKNTGSGSATVKVTAITIEPSQSSQGSSGADSTP